MELKIVEGKEKKQKPTGALGFGKYFTDRMFVMEYENGAWGNARITPYAPFSLDPSTAVFHYAQAIFEGTKAYKNQNGEIRLFRPRDNFLRLNDSGDRVCIPPVDVDFVTDCLTKLVLMEKDWIPTEPGTALYIRPSVIATDAALGVHASKKYILYHIEPRGGLLRARLRAGGAVCGTRIRASLQGRHGTPQGGGQLCRQLKGR